MANLSQFNPNIASNPNNNLFGLPVTEEDARIVIIPIPWEVTASYHSGTARSAEHVLRASLQVDLCDSDNREGWRQGYFLREPDRKILMKSDYLRKEAELYIDYISKGEEIGKNTFMCKSLKEINEGGEMLNQWVFEQTQSLIGQGKLVGLLGGDHSVALGYYKAIAAKHPEFGILQIDAHCDLRAAYEGFSYSHASVMYNALSEIPQITRLVQAGVRDYSHEESDYIRNSRSRVVTYFDKDIKEHEYEGRHWSELANEIAGQLPEKVFISMDIDGLDPKLCPNTGTPVPGGFEAEQVYYLLRCIQRSGRQFIGFDLCEVGVGETDWDANVGARLLFKLCNFLVSTQKQPSTTTAPANMHG